MQIRKVVTALAIAGSCMVTGLAVATPAHAAVTSANQTVAAPDQGDHWETLGTYITYTACQFDGKWIVANSTDYVDYRCLFDSNQDEWVLQGLYDPL